MTVKAKVVVAVALGCDACGRTIESTEAIDVERGGAGALLFVPASTEAAAIVLRLASKVGAAAMARGWVDVCGQCRDKDSPVGATEVKVGRDPREHRGDDGCS